MTWPAMITTDNSFIPNLRSGPSTTLSHVIQTLNIDQTTNKSRVPHMERVDTLKTIEEENIELLSIKKDET